MFLLFGVEAACGKKCCVVNAADRGAVTDIDGELLFECRFAEVRDGIIICTNGIEWYYLDPDTCEELPGEASAIVREPLKGAGYKNDYNAQRLSHNAWLVLASKEEGCVLVAVENGKVRELRDSWCGCYILDSIQPGIKLVACPERDNRVAYMALASASRYVELGEPVKEIIDIDVVFPSLMTTDIEVEDLGMIEGKFLGAKILFPGYYAGSTCCWVKLCYSTAVL